MRYSAEHKQETRERIVRAASRRFRRSGSEASAIGKLMHDLKLTHGGFYRHFDNKEALFAEAFEQAVQEVDDRIEARLAKAPPGRELEALVDAYLDPRHCDDMAGGCPVAALASEVARRPRGARTRVLESLRRHIRRMAKYLPGTSEKERRRKAIALFSGMAGTLTIARAFTDEREQRAILEGSKSFYLAAARS
jgi:TetR/AcrR family transcriptional regulator, transcriptional repressor for nem operon